MVIIPVPKDDDQIRELRDDLKDLSKSLKAYTKTTDRFNGIIFLFTVVQILVALFQFVQSFAFSDNNEMTVWGIAASGSVVVFLIYFGEKVFNKKI